MRVLLINPPMVNARGNIWHGVSGVMPPLGVAWMAAVLEKEGHAVAILDAHAERVDLARVGQAIRDRGRPDLIGITASTMLIDSALGIARIARAEAPAAKIVLGGVHPTALPDEVLAEPAVDWVVRGEGERTIVELAGGARPGDVAGLSWRDGGAVRHNGDRELIDDLDSLPLPAWHLLPIRRYRPAVGGYRRLPAVSMLATRGCPGRCTFCYRIFGNRLRYRGGRRLAEEARYLQDRFGIREVCFYDDTFSAIRPEVLAFCKGLEELQVDLTWSCFSRVDAVDEEVLAAMKRAGCHQIMYGVETASDEILAGVGKRVDCGSAARAVERTRRAGIDVRAAFMFGNPGETKETMERTLAMAIRLDPPLAIFNITTPYPGTEMFEWAERRGILRSRRWSDYDLAHMVMDLPTVAARDVEAFYRKAYRRFFLRPRFLARRLARLRRWSDFKQAVRAVRAVAGV